MIAEYRVDEKNENINNFHNTYILYRIIKIYNIPITTNILLLHNAGSTILKPRSANIFYSVLCKQGVAYVVKILDQ